MLSKEQNTRTVIQIRKTTREVLNSFGKKNQSYDDVINDLIMAKKAKDEMKTKNKRVKSSKNEAS